MANKNITPEMIRAGSDAVSTYSEDGGESWSDAAVRIYSAMEQARVAGESSTPRTDAELQTNSVYLEKDMVLADFARELERDLDRREKQLIECQQKLIERNYQLYTVQSCKHARVYGLVRGEESSFWCADCYARLRNYPWGGP